jgi:branched-chain amino acid transport system ATP-binding protein
MQGSFRADALNSSELDDALALIRKIAAMGITIIIEHVLCIMLSLVERRVVLHHGLMLSDGPLAAALNDQAVISAYLGTRCGKRHQAALGHRMLPESR